jgi:adenine deaminase
LDYSKKNDAADFIIINNLQDFDILETYIDGNLVAQNGKSFIETEPDKIINNFSIDFKKEEDFQIKLASPKINAIEVIDGQLITKTYIGNCFVR